jgi:hypothetical protein
MINFVHSRRGVHLERKRDAGAPGWTANSWLSSLTLLDILGEALLVESDHTFSDEVDCVKGLSDAMIDNAVAAAAVQMKAELKDAVATLQKNKEVDAHLLNEKFAADKDTFTAFSMAVNKVKQTEPSTKPTEETKQEEECEVAHNVKPPVTKEQMPSPPSSCGAAPTWAGSMWMISSTAVVIRLCERLLVEVPTGESEADKIRQLTEDQIQAVLEDPKTVQELVRALMAGIEELNMQDEVDASKLNDKFVADGSGFAYVYGDMVDYHGGLEGARDKLAGLAALHSHTLPSLFVKDASAILIRMCCKRWYGSI